MQIKKVLSKMLLVTMLIIMCNSCMCYASKDGRPGTIDPGGDGGGNTNNSNTSTPVEGNSALGLPSLDDTYKPSVSISTTGESRVRNIIVNILNILTIIGVIAIVVSIAIIGFGSILGSASEKAVSQEKYIGIIIAAALITGGSVIAKMIISVAESI